MPLWKGKFSQSHVKPAKGMFIPVLLESNWMAECLNGCICNIAVLWKMLGGEIDSRKSCWSGTERTTDNFRIAPRHRLLQYVLEKIALLANSLCVHKLYKVEWFKKIYLKQAVHTFYWNVYMQMQKSFKTLKLHQLLFDSCLGSVKRISPLRKSFHPVGAFLHLIFFFFLINEI